MLTSKLESQPLKPQSDIRQTETSGLRESMLYNRH